MNKLAILYCIRINIHNRMHDLYYLYAMRQSKRANGSSFDRFVALSQPMKNAAHIFSLRACTSNVYNFRPYTIYVHISTYFV